LHSVMMEVCTMKNSSQEKIITLWSVVDMTTYPTVTCTLHVTIRDSSQTACSSQDSIYVQWFCAAKCGFQIF
jgi:hypothetical protein